MKSLRPPSVGESLHWLFGCSVPINCHSVSPAIFGIKICHAKQIQAIKITSNHHIIVHNWIWYCCTQRLPRPAHSHQWQAAMHWTASNASMARSGRNWSPAWCHGGTSESTERPAICKKKSKTYIAKHNLCSWCCTHISSCSCQFSQNFWYFLVSFGHQFLWLRSCAAVAMQGSIYVCGGMASWGLFIDLFIRVYKGSTHQHHGLSLGFVHSHTSEYIYNMIQVELLYKKHDAPIWLNPTGGRLQWWSAIGQRRALRSTLRHSVLDGKKGRWNLTTWCEMFETVKHMLDHVYSLDHVDHVGFSECIFPFSQPEVDTLNLVWVYMAIETMQDPISKPSPIPYFFQMFAPAWDPRRSPNLWIQGWWERVATLPTPRKHVAALARENTLQLWFLYRCWDVLGIAGTSSEPLSYCHLSCVFSSSFHVCFPIVSSIYCSITLVLVIKTPSNGANKLAQAVQPVASGTFLEAMTVQLPPLEMCHGSSEHSQNFDKTIEVEKLTTIVTNLFPMFLIIVSLSIKFHHSSNPSIIWKRTHIST